jgi:hypothetical protein
MTLSIDGTNIGEIIEIAVVVGSIVTMLIVGLLIYLMVRPPRRSREVRRPEPEAIESEELLQLLDRMEQRLAVLERAVGDENEGKVLERAEGPETRRIT